MGIQHDMAYSTFEGWLDGFGSGGAREFWVFRTNR